MTIKHPGTLDGVGDHSNLKEHKWGVMVPEGEEGRRLFDAIKPLVELRASQVGSSAIEPTLIPKGLEGPTEWTDDVVEEWVTSFPGAPVPGFLLLLGGVDEISYEVQRALSISNRSVGRLVFPKVEDYETYAKNVREWEGQNLPGSDLGFVIVTALPEKLEVAFFHKCFGSGAPIESPFAGWGAPQAGGSQSDVHPVRSIQQAINRPGQPFPILARVPLAWLNRGPSPSAPSAGSLAWRSSNEDELKGVFGNALGKPEIWRVGLALSRRSNTTVIKKYRDVDSTIMLLGDPALLLDAAVKKTKSPV